MTRIVYKSPGCGGSLMTFSYFFIRDDDNNEVIYNNLSYIQGYHNVKMYVEFERFAVGNNDGLWVTMMNIITDYNHLQMTFTWDCHGPSNVDGIYDNSYDPLNDFLNYAIRSPFEAGPSVPCGDGQSGSNNDQTYGARSRGQLTMIQEVDLEEDVDLGCISPDEIGLDDYDFDHTEYNYNDVNDEHDGDGRSNQTENQTLVW
ncbi:uncharacterized protein [Euphorbia lathyris]|uniref:uncharacterized protein isoform X1 n=1 Tax=Euphorbia lathyris TaxID=212925 RepID=UPI00331345A3